MKSSLLKISENFNVEFVLHKDVFSLFPALFWYRIDTKNCINLFFWIFEIELQFLKLNK